MANTQPEEFEMVEMNPAGPQQNEDATPRRINMRAIRAGFARLMPDGHYARYLPTIRKISKIIIPSAVTIIVCSYLFHNLYTLRFERNIIGEVMRYSDCPMPPVDSKIQDKYDANSRSARFSSQCSVIGLNHKMIGSRDKWIKRFCNGVILNDHGILIESDCLKKMRKDNELAIYCNFGNLDEFKPDKQFGHHSGKVCEVGPDYAVLLPDIAIDFGANVEKSCLGPFTANETSPRKLAMVSDLLSNKTIGLKSQPIKNVSLISDEHCQDFYLSLTKQDPNAIILVPDDNYDFDWENLNGFLLYEHHLGAVEPQGLTSYSKQSFLGFGGEFCSYYNDRNRTLLSWIKLEPIRIPGSLEFKCRSLSK